MKYFKDAQNNVYEFESDGSQDKFIRPELTPITKAKADALRAPVLSNAEFNAIVDAQLDAADLKIIRAITEGDTARIEEHKAAQAALRATRK
ncbi:hypothetical protein SAMN05216420_101409 [Nitrosospira sp. Nl5]|uniref:hypothetical protein n=1 Tax=Nitrosospira sp. Nl5 TaxID=200120 RepID=UPI00088DE4C3|nr:hypothetical protein [Nitrosospira sp. Nl5]SCX94509.1 hypothetical protein SAMN05216420_101409 [Nitrosospira sp. Nl5]